MRDIENISIFPTFVRPDEDALHPSMKHIGGELSVKEIFKDANNPSTALQDVRSPAPDDGTLAYDIVAGGYWPRRGGTVANDNVAVVSERITHWAGVRESESNSWLERPQSDPQYQAFLTSSIFSHMEEPGKVTLARKPPTKALNKPVSDFSEQDRNEGTFARRPDSVGEKKDDSHVSSLTFPPAWIHPAGPSPEAPAYIRIFDRARATYSNLERAFRHREEQSKAEQQQLMEEKSEFE